jgi:hypothetical protein
MGNSVGAAQDRADRSGRREEQRRPGTPFGVGPSPHPAYSVLWACVRSSAFVVCRVEPLEAGRSGAGSARLRAGEPGRRCALMVSVRLDQLGLCDRLGALAGAVRQVLRPFGG